MDDYTLVVPYVNDYFHVSIKYDIYPSHTVYNKSGKTAQKTGMLSYHIDHQKNA